MSPINLESYEFIGIDHLTGRRGAMFFHRKQMFLISKVIEKNMAGIFNRVPIVMH